MLAAALVVISCLVLTAAVVAPDANDPPPVAARTQRFWVGGDSLSYYVGTALTERQGLAFLQTVHMTRAAATARNGLAPKASDFEAAAAYAALGREACDRGNG